MRELRTAVAAVIAITVVLGLAYPLALTGVAQVAMPGRANGSTALGRDFAEDPGAFQSRPSATGYSATATAFGNQGPNQAALASQLRGLVRAYLARERPFTPGLTAADIPADAVTSSASGVDPDISAANARIQANRVARRHALPLARVLALVREHSSRPLAGLAGPRSVHVGELNAALAAEAAR